MKKLFALILSCLAITACSAADPDITSATISDTNPVAGQRILLELHTVSNYPPMHYAWTATAGSLDVNDTYYAYWTAPDVTEATTCTVRCAVTDDEDGDTTTEFTLNVQPRTVKTLETSGTTGIIADDGSKTAGVWVGSTESNLSYYTSGTSSTKDWGKGLAIMTLQRVQSLFTSWSTIWGVDPADPTRVTYQTTEGVKSLACPYPEKITEGETEIDNPDRWTNITALAMQGNLLWVGADNGLHRGDLSSGVWTRDIDDNDATDIAGPVNDLWATTDLVCAATGNGLYKLAKDATSWEPVTAGDFRTVFSDSDKVVWGISADDHLFKDGANLLELPAAGIKSITEDLDKKIWCGKYRLNDAEDGWDEPVLDETDNPITDTVEESVVSTEGLLYMRTADGKLVVWGK